MAGSLLIEVIHASPVRARIKAYRLAAPANIADALRRAAADPDFAGIDFTHCAVGIFGRTAARDAPLADGDRVEIYRSLAEDPKSARRRRAAPRPRQR